MRSEKSGEIRVRTNGLHFDVSLCIQIKKQLSVRGRRHWVYISCGILDPAAVQDFKKNLLLQLIRDIINGVCC